MILRLTAHRNNADVVVIHAGPELAEFMGAFPAARWQATSKAYWFPVAQLEILDRHAARSGHIVVDDRKAAAEPEKFVGPLPECANPSCGQLIRRGSTPAYCPACGSPWQTRDQPAAIRRPDTRAECGSCGRPQTGTFPRCSACGQPMVQVVTGGRPDHVPRPKLAEPDLFGDIAGEVVEEMRDHAQRAAGDR